MLKNTAGTPSLYPRPKSRSQAKSEAEIVLDAAAEAIKRGEAEFNALNERFNKLDILSLDGATARAIDELKQTIHILLDMRPDEYRTVMSRVKTGMEEVEAYLKSSNTDSWNSLTRTYLINLCSTGSALQNLVTTKYMFTEGGLGDLP